MWAQQQQKWGKSSHEIPSIPTNTILYPGKPYLGVENPLWGQPSLMKIPQKGKFSNKSVNPMIPTQYSPQT
jgi:hypothetical protein